MGYPGSTALVRAKGFGDLPELVEQRAGERVLLDVFEKEGLPVALRDAPGTPMPLGAMMGLFDRAAASLEDRTFGLTVGERMTYRGYGRWVEYGTGAATLGEAVARLVATSWAHMSGARLALVEKGDVSLLRFSTPPLGVSKLHHCDHLLPPMLTFIRLYLGPKWLPEWAEVEYARDPKAGQVEDWLQVPLLCGRPGSGLALKTADLGRPRPLNVPAGGPVVTLRDVLADVILADAPEPARALSAVVALRLLDGQSDIEGAACLVGLSVQGLQRRLRQKGYTYREILDAARRARAVRLLLETSMSVLAVGLSLGYETHASFTRAFLRWVGCTPSEFRQARGTAARMTAGLAGELAGP